MAAKKETAAVPALERLHAALADTLKDAMKGEPVTVTDKETGEVTVVGMKLNAAVLSVARQFLKDNGIEAIPAEGSPLAGLHAALPFAARGDDPEEHGVAH